MIFWKTSMIFVVDNTDRQANIGFNPKYYWLLSVYPAHRSYESSKLNVQLFFALRNRQSTTAATWVTSVPYNPSVAPNIFWHLRHWYSPEQHYNLINCSKPSAGVLPWSCSSQFCPCLVFQPASRCHIVRTVSHSNSAWSWSFYIHTQHNCFALHPNLNDNHMQRSTDSGFVNYILHHIQQDFTETWNSDLFLLGMYPLLHGMHLDAL